MQWRDVSDCVPLPAVERDPQAVGGSEVGWCLDKAVFTRILGREIPATGVMKRGSYLHENLLPALVEHLYVQGQDHPVLFEYPFHFGQIRGHVDAVIPSMNLVVEFKTTNTNIEDASYLSAYLMQVHLYLYCLQQLGVVERPEGRLLVLNLSRGDSWLQEAVVIPDRVIADLALNRAHLIIEYVAARQPIANGPEFEWECIGCPFVPECVFQQGVGQELLAQLPMTRTVAIAQGVRARLDALVEQGVAELVKEANRYVYRRKT